MTLINKNPPDYWYVCDLPGCSQEVRLPDQASIPFAYVVPAPWRSWHGEVGWLHFCCEAHKQQHKAQAQE